MATAAQDIALDKLHDSPFQRRKKYTHIDELAASMMGDAGVLQSLLVRPHPAKKGEYELVAGHRRKRAAKKAGLESVPCLVRDLDDREVRRAILVENGQRENVPPLEELETYVELRKDGMEVEEIASSVGRAAGHIYRRLQLERLGKQARVALAAEHLTVRVAEMIARIEDKRLQSEAVEHLSGDEQRAPASAARAKSWIENYASMRLKDADFSPDDPDLLKAVGACGGCSKNTAVATMLFPEMAGDARCTDSKCYSRKRDAAWAQTKAKAIKDGKAPLEGEDLEKAFSQYGGLSRAWTDLGSTVWVDGKSKKVRAALGTRLKGLAIHVARDPHSGRAVEVVHTKDLKAAVKLESRETDPYEWKGADNAATAEHKRQRAVAKERDELLSVLLAEGVRDGKAPGLAGSFWQLLALGVCRRAWADTKSAALKRRDIEVGKEEVKEEVLELWVLGERKGVRPWDPTEVIVSDDGQETQVPKNVTADVTDLQVFIFEMLLMPELTFGMSSYLELVCDAMGIDLKKVAAEAKATVAQREKAKADRAKERAKRKKEREEKKAAKEAAKKSHNRPAKKKAAKKKAAKKKAAKKTAAKRPERTR